DDVTINGDGQCQETYGGEERDWRDDYIAVQVNAADLIYNTIQVTPSGASDYSDRLQVTATGDTTANIFSGNVNGGSVQNYSFNRPSLPLGNFDQVNAT